MIFLVHSEVTAQTIAGSMGQSEYSYYFVLKEFLAVLRELGDVHIVQNPRVEVDRLYALAIKAKQPCVFLSFTPPHNTPLGLRCPTIPVLAWEFDSIPNEHWFGERQQDWRYGLARCGRAITHSGMTVEAIRAEMGADFPVISIPAPVWDKYASLRERLASQARRDSVTLRVSSCVLLDSHDSSLAAYMPDQQAIAAFVATTRQQETANLKAAVLPSARQETLPRITYRYLREWYQLVGRELFSEWRAHAKRRLLGRPEPEPIAELVLPQWQPRQHELQLSGVVFTSLFNPYDGRKNWDDMLTAFCTAFRDCSDATLLFKLGSHDCQAAMSDMLMCMARLPAFSCRVVIVHGFLEGESFESLIEASHFIVNASYGEGQCLPLMEFLSCGRPVVAPRNSALLDYIDSEVGFVVEGWQDATAWSHDPRRAFRTCRQQINWESLVSAYRLAYHCAREEPQRYAELSLNAIARMRDHCSRQVARERLKAFLNIEGILS